MFKRHNDKLDVSTTLLGFGCMRFPTKDGHIDEEAAEAMLDRAYAAGINYYDTAYPYHNGESEPFVGKVMSKFDRESFYFATKLPLWNVNSLDDAKRLFAEQLERLRTSYIDFYLLHAFNHDSFKKMKELGVIEYLVSLKEEGKIRHLGFSFHDSFDVFKDILEYGDWDFCQIQFNYMDTEEQAGLDGYALAESLGVPLIIMEPVKGGLLANLPEDISEGFKELRPDASTASWALRYVGSFPNVQVVLSGMSTMEQLNDNIEIFNDFEPLSEEEQKAVANTAKTLKSRVFNGCTGCRYCMPCPAGVDIPGNFRLWNEYGIYHNGGHTAWTWKNMISADKKALACLECGACEAVCPQHLSIREDLKNAQKLLDEVSGIEG